METIWITGGKGFIGRHLGQLIKAKGDVAFGIGHGLWPPEEAASWGFKVWSNGEIEASNLSQLMQVSGPPTLVYHLAGGSAVGASFQNPYEDFTRTVESSARLLEWLRLNAPQARVICVSSAAVYGAGYHGQIPENAATSPYSPYGNHKFIMESLCRSYAENFGIRVAIVRLFSVYGAGLEKQLVWDLCCKLERANGATVTLGGNGNELRDWLHVLDAAKLLWLASKHCSAETTVIFNGGSGVGIPIRDVADLVCDAWGGANGVSFSGVARKGDPYSLVADGQLLSSLGFQPEVSLVKGLQGAVDWFKSRN